MSLRVSSTAFGPSGLARSGLVQPGLAQPGDGQRLAASLRTSRLTTLYGTAGSGKSTLLHRDVLPMLHRRATDMAVPHGLAPRVVIPFADRRRGSGAFGHVRRAEVAVLFDDWSFAPLPQLLDQVHQAMGIAEPAPTAARLSLAGSLAALNMQFGARFLIILDRFEACLAAAEQQPAVREFLDQLVQALNRPLLPVNFLIAVRAESRAQLDDLRARVPGFDDQSLELGAPPEARMPLRRVPASAPEPAPDPAPAPDANPDPPPPPDLAAMAAAVLVAAVRERAPTGSEDDWHRAIGAIVQRAAVAARRELAEDSGPGSGSPVAPEAAPAASEAPPQASPESPADGFAGLGWPETASAEPPEPMLFSGDWRAPRSPDDAAAADHPALAADDERAFPATTTFEDDDVPPPRIPIPPTPAPTRTLSRKVEFAVWLAAGVVFLGYGAWVLISPRGEPAELAAAGPVDVPSNVPSNAPAAATAVAPAPARPTPTPASPPVAPTALAAAGIDATPRPLIELARALAPASPTGTRVAAAVDWPAGFVTVPGAPQFAVARYDALQAARRQGVTAPLQVLAPLYVDPVYFVVRADSPMTKIHDIEGAAINAGPAESSRAVTAAAIYRRLFDKALPDRPVLASGADAAIGQLLDGTAPRGQGVDVVVLAGPQPSAWLAKLPPATAQAVKLLALDPNGAADRRALQAYLPATLRAGPAEGTRSLAVMSFLVAADAADGVAGVKALCAALPALQQNGDPIWREVQPGLQLEAGWPASPAAQQAWRGCAPHGQ